MLRKRLKAFTLSELLIALSILGVIATFTIPKVLQNQQDSKYNAMAKEAIAMTSDAYAVLKSKQGVSASTLATALTPYMNYVRVDTASSIDDIPGGTTTSCTSVHVCLVLHNGALLQVPGANFNGTDSTNAVLLQLDPDGKVTDGTTNGPGKSLKFVLYYNGKIRTRETLDSNTISGGATYNPAAGADPSWFSWK